MIKDKFELRKYATTKRNKMFENGQIKVISDLIVSKILNSSEFKNAKNIALYYPIKSEADITKIMKIRNKNFYLPRCKNMEIEFVKYDSNLNLIKGCYGIYEPTGKAIKPEILDLIYIPALMANSKGYRLGWGKGYYDRFFTKNKISAKKIIVIGNEFISDNFVEDENDYKCDMVLCEK